MAGVYLDYNAGAPMHPAVREAMITALAWTGNPSSVHKFGRDCRLAVEAARADIAALVGVRARQVVFCSGGTEANNTALRGCGGDHHLVSVIEHESVRAAVPEATVIEVDRTGVIDLAALDAALRAADRPSLVSVMLVNNETGVIQPVEEAVRLAHRHRARFHCDAVQAAGRLSLAERLPGVELISLSAHKLGGPQGIGALVVAEGLAIEPFMRGGGQEQRRRAGTENVAGIVGFGVAARLAAERVTDNARLAGWRDQMEARMRSTVSGLKIFGAEAPRVGNTSCVATPGVSAETQLMALDLAGVAVGSGSACSSGKLTPSTVLRAMGASDDLARSAIRISLGWATKSSDLDHMIAAWTELVHRARPRMSAA